MIGRGSIARRSAEVGANAVRARFRRRKGHRRRRASRRGLLRRDVAVVDRVARRLAPFHQLRRAVEGALLQDEFEFLVAARLAVEAEDDRIDLERFAGGRDEITAQTDDSVAREGDERLRVGDREIRDVGRLGIDAIVHRVREIARNVHGNAARTVATEHDVLLRHLRIDRRWLFRIEPGAPEIELFPTWRCVRRLRARHVIVRLPTANRCAVKIGTGGPGVDGRADRDAPRVECQLDFEVRRLELCDAETAAQRFAVGTRGVDFVVPDRRALGNRERDRERSERVGRASSEDGLLPAGIGDRHPVRCCAAANERAVLVEICNAGELRGLAGLVERAI